MCVRFYAYEFAQGLPFVFVHKMFSHDVSTLQVGFDVLDLNLLRLDNFTKPIDRNPVRSMNMAQLGENALFG